MSAEETPIPSCRCCGAAVTRTFVDLGVMPLANSYLTAGQLDEIEPRYPLHARVCDRCLLVQIEAVVPAERIFCDYAYFSSYSTTWVEHARRFADDSSVRLGLDADSLVVELASNDGYLLQHFVAAGIPVLGVEPAANVARVAIEKGIRTKTAFFGMETAARLVAEGFTADLLVANNVFAHVPDLQDFVAGMTRILKPDGVISIEVPWLLRLITDVQFDTIYHEHFSYFSLYTAERALLRHGLAVYDVEQLPTHGGSLRIWASHADRRRQPSPELLQVRDEELRAGIHQIETYAGFQQRADACRRSLLAFLSSARAANRSVVAYGAAAKGNTLLNYCNISPDEISFVVDRSPHKQGHFLPGTHLPIHAPEDVLDAQPSYVLILAWNLRAEIMEQMAHISLWGGRFVTPVPEVVVYS